MQKNTKKRKLVIRKGPILFHSTVIDLVFAGSGVPVLSRRRLQAH